MTSTPPALNNQDSVPAPVPERVAAFEPCRAVVRPRACNERAGCWVKVGAAGCTGSATSSKCTACNDSIQLAGNEAAHGAMLRRVLVELNT